MRPLVLLLALLVACIALVASAPPSPVKPEHRVKLRVFFRAFCPACQWFVGDPLLELIRNPHFRQILDFEVFPAAGMTNKGGLECEGGPLECEGHRWEACVVEKDRDDLVKYLGGIACLEGDESGEVGEWQTKLKNCFTEHEREELQECYDKRADELLKVMMREEGFSDVQWMPYTVVNGNVLGSASRGVGLSELQTNVCSSYKGPKKYYPSVCVGLVGEQQVFADEPPKQKDVVDHVTPAPVQKVALKDDPEEAAKEEENALAVAEKENAEETGKVRLEVYWRAFCPGCMAFITKPLLRLLRDEQFRDIIDFRPVPAAGTFYDSTGKFICNKGMVECIGHQWLSCAIAEFPQLDQQIEHLACLESRENNKGSSWDVVITKCFHGADHTTMTTCFKTKSVELLKRHIAQRDKVDLRWMPYVLVNGKVLGDARTGIGYKQLLEEVCQAYSGSVELRPLACQPKRLRGEHDEQDAETGEDKNNDQVVKPCPPKKGDKPKAAGAAAVVNEDAPGAGFRRPNEEEARNGAAVPINDEAQRDGSSSFSFQSLLFPLGCFAIIAMVAKSVSGGHKKDA